MSDTPKSAAEMAMRIYDYTPSEFAKRNALDPTLPVNAYLKGHAEALKLADGLAEVCEMLLFLEEGDLLPELKQALAHYRAGICRDCGQKVMLKGVPND